MKISEQIDKRVIRVTGNDASKFLQNMLTCDVRKIGLGQSSLACHCSQKGKIISVIYVCKTNEGFDLIVDANFVEATQTSLEKYIIIDDVFLKVTSDSVYFLQNELPSHAFSPFKVLAISDFYILVTQLQNEGGLKDPSGQGSFETWDFDHTRILRGEPKMGLDIGNDHFPAESDFINTYGVSYTKGCYIGQETMARLQARGGNVAHKLTWITFQSENSIPLPQKVFFNQEIVGECTSLTREGSKYIGLAMVHRKALDQMQPTHVHLTDLQIVAELNKIELETK